MTTKKASAKKPAKKASAKKTSAKKAKPAKKINELFPNLIPVTEEEETTSEKKSGKKKDLSEKQIKELERKLSICEVQAIRHKGTPVEVSYKKQIKDICDQLGRDISAPWKR